MAVVVVLLEDEVPPVAAVPAPVGDDVADLPAPVLPRDRDQVARAAAVDTDNGLARLDHLRSLSCMRVVAGELRGRRIASPSGDATRPTTDKVREAVFNALVSLGAVEDAEVLDLFAGTGAMGIEALSRGAARCTFVERDKAALATLRENIRTLGVEQRSTVIAGDATTGAAAPSRADIVIADPPYGFADWAGLLSHVPQGALVILESGSPVEVPPGWECLREKKYGRTFVAFLRFAEGPDGTVSPS